MNVIGACSIGISTPRSRATRLEISLVTTSCYSIEPCGRGSSPGGLHPETPSLGMATEVLATGDPGLVLREAGAFLESDPVRHNVILWLLHGRVAVPAPGRY